MEGHKAPPYPFPLEGAKLVFFILIFILYIKIMGQKKTAC
jgi:hypothetical protein